METLAVIALVLFALLLGFVIPVLLQLRATLKSAQEFIDSTSLRVDSALQEVSQLTVRVNAIAGEVEDNLPRVRRMLEATDGVVNSLEGLQRSMKVIGAVGPAAFAAVKAVVASFAASRSREEAGAEEDEISAEASERATAS